MTTLDKIKLHFTEWDADRNPQTLDYINFRNQFENMVDTINGGYDLIDFVLFSQGRERITSSLVPSSLQTNMWADDESDMDSDDEPLATAIITERKQITTYKELSKVSKELDKMLFPILQRCVKGSKSALLNKCHAKFSQGMFLLHEHFLISKSKRKTEAFAKLRSLKFTGDVQQYQVEALTVITEIFDAKCSIKDLIMSEIMSSFEGINKQIQHEIAADLDEGSDNLNIHDAIARYMSHIATVSGGDSPLLAINANAAQRGPQVCSRCRKPNHTREQCFARKDVDFNILPDQPPCEEPEWYKKQRQERRAMLANHAGLTEEHLSAIAKQIHSLNNMKKYPSHQCSVLDSGSGIHLDPNAVVTNPNEQIDVIGFNNSRELTQGAGFLPCVFQDVDTGDKFSLAITDCHRMDQVSKTLFSLGKMLRQGFTMVAKDHGNHIRLRTPDGAHVIRVELGDDDILYLKHELQSDGDLHFANYVKKQLSHGTYEMMHFLFNHAGKSKILKTLEHTKGLTLHGKAYDFFCPTCAMAKNKRKGMRHSRPCCVCDPEHEPIEDDGLQQDDNHLVDNEDDYVAPVQGDVIHGSNMRFDIAKLRPFEVMFGDNKEYPCPVRGGKIMAFVLVDLATFAIFKVDVHSKMSNGKAFRKIASEHGIHKLPYKCTVYSDGCGSMEYVKATALSLGINYQPTPPYDSSLNVAEKAIDIVFGAARTMMAADGGEEIWGHFYPQAVDYACYVHFLMATTAERGFKTPYERIKGMVPDVSHLRVMFSECFPKFPDTQESHPCVFLGFQTMMSRTYKVLTDDKRIVRHTRHVNFDLDNIVFRERLDERIEEPRQVPVVEAPVVDLEEVDNAEEADEDAALSSIQEPASSESDEASSSESDDIADEPNPMFEEPQLRRSQRQRVQAHEHDAKEYFDVCEMERAHRQNHTHTANANLAFSMAMHATKDTPWSDLLRRRPIESKKAIDAEIHSLVHDCKVLVPINEEHPDYQEAKRDACGGRIIGTERRDDTVKARAVKQGCKEDLPTADGPDFNYYSHVAKFASARTLLLRANRGNRRIALKDIRTAFLQAHKYPPGAPKKYIKFKHPVTNEWMYFRQMGPIYGENSAPKHWENTFFPWIKSLGFVQGENEPCVFYHPARDLVVLVYVDDVLVDGYDDDIEWFFKAMDARFACKGDEWLTPETPLDYLGIEVSMDKERLYLTMEDFTEKTLRAMDMDECAPADRPITREITDLTPLSGHLRTKFMTGVGCVGWLVNTARPDLAYAHSRISQHMANPVQGALDALLHVMRYLRQTTRVGLSTSLYGSTNWEFFCDSDYASNTEPQNKRKSQNGYIALQGGVPVMWGSKVSSVAFAHPDIGEAHADVSSGAAEVYAAANATFEFLHLSYVVDEIKNIEFPKPIEMQVDNTTAEVFINNTAFKSKMKHIDCRQEWVMMLRDKSILVPKHVNTLDNLADIFTKILGKHDFQRFFSRLMTLRPHHIV